MKRSGIPVLALASMGALSACGGGGGSTASTSTNTPAAPSSFDAAMAISLTGSEAPAETIADQERRWPEITQRTDSLTASTIYGETDDPELPRFNIAADCEGTTCVLTEPRTGYTLSFALDDSLNEESDPGTERTVLTKNGITLVEFSESGSNYRGYGSWMEHGAFSVATAARDADESRTLTYRYALAGGDLAGSPPSASATWRGVMVGTPARGDHRDDILQGDATLVYDAGTRTLDADFTDIMNLDREAPHTVTEAGFDNVPVDADGTYVADGGVGNLIRGGFAGPDHEETGGIFEQGGIVGAFGAKRQ